MYHETSHHACALRIPHAHLILDAVHLGLELQVFALGLRAGEKMGGNKQGPSVDRICGCKGVRDVFLYICV